MHSFRHGVASFDPLADGVLLWTRVDPGATSVTWRVAAAPADPHARPEEMVEHVVAEGVSAVDPDGDGCVTVDVDGLEPATTYHFWFEVDGALSPVGRTRTLPVGTDWARVAFVCCADRSMGGLSAYRAIAEDEVDLVVHLGDYLYEEPKGPFAVEPPGVTVTLDDYRRRHAHTRLDPDLQALHLRHPMVFVWDDHDTADNAWRHGAKAHDEEVQGPWEQRLAAATRAREEWLPCRLSDPSDPLDMHRSVRLGDLAELVVLDTRIPGRDLQAGDDGAKPLDAPDRRIVPRRPDGLGRGAPRRPVRHLGGGGEPGPGRAAPDPRPARGRGRRGDAERLPGRRREALCTDQWDGYPVQRARLAAALDRRDGAALVVSGDVHSNWAALVLDPSGERAVAADFVTTSVSATAMGEQLPSGWRSLAETVSEEVADQVWNDLEHHGYLRLDIRPEELRGDWIGGRAGGRAAAAIGARLVGGAPRAAGGAEAGHAELLTHLVRRRAPPGAAPGAAARTRASGRRPLVVVPRARRAATYAAVVGSVVGAGWVVRRRRHHRR